MALLPFRAAQQAEAGGLAIAYERTRDRFRNRFEDPSSFDQPSSCRTSSPKHTGAITTGSLLRGRYKAASRLLEMEVAATPQRSTRGDDYDTFFQPSGDVVVVGNNRPRIAKHHLAQLRRRDSGGPHVERRRLVHDPRGRYRAGNERKADDAAAG